MLSSGAQGFDSAWADSFDTSTASAHMPRLLAAGSGHFCGHIRTASLRDSYRSPGPAASMLISFSALSLARLRIAHFSLFIRDVGYIITAISHARLCVGTADAAAVYSLAGVTTTISFKYFDSFTIGVEPAQRIIYDMMIFSRPCLRDAFIVLIGAPSGHCRTGELM